MNNCKSCSKEPIGQINVARFIEKLDACFSSGDIASAIKTVQYWENEARELCDMRGLLSVINEELGLYRRIGDKEKGLVAVKAAKELLEMGIAEGKSAATVYVNLATTLSAFGKAEESLKYYDMAEKLYCNSEIQGIYEYAAMLNNKSSALIALGKFDDGELCLRRAIEILKDSGKYDADIALSYISLAHLYYDRDESAYDSVEELLDTAWEYINSGRQTHDADYAFAISKCAPSFKYFGREPEAEALLETAKEIYGGDV